MSDTCARKAEGARRLARYFRDKAAETQWADFIDMMNEAADDLDALAQSLPCDCRSGERGEAAPPAPAAGAASPAKAADGRRGGR